MLRLERWRRLPESHGNVVDLLAGVDALLGGMEQEPRATIRWSVATTPALILGSSQRLTEIDFATCQAAGVSVHKRRSGGGAVYADTDLLWLDVALPTAHPLHLTDMTRSYRWFGEVWAAALETLGLPVRVPGVDEARQLNRALPPVVQRACYGGVSPYEVLMGDRKIVGLAQVRRHGGAVLQSGVYLHWRAEQVSDLLQGSADERRERTRLLQGRAVGLADLSTPPMSFSQVVAAWEKAVADNLGIELVLGTWSDHEQLLGTTERGRYAALEAPAGA